MDKIFMGNYPLGDKLADSAHSVATSLPTLEGVIKYEEKDPDVMRKMRSGYPRFVTHEYVQMLHSFLVGEYNLEDQSVYLVSSEKIVPGLQAFLKRNDIKVIQENGFVLAHHPRSLESEEKAKKFLQHTGCTVYSRQAEAALKNRGMCTLSVEEKYSGNDPEAIIKKEFIKAIQEGHEDDTFLTSCGMNTIYASFKSLSLIQKKRGRTKWIQLGWLYLDTISILKSFCEDPDDYIFITDFTDFSSIRNFIEKHSSEIAGVVTEIPNNPLIRTIDLPELYKVCSKNGIACIADPTVASPVNVKILNHCDVSAVSLTKYAAGEGDVMMGAILLNPESQFYTELKETLPNFIQKPYIGDIQRMALEIPNYSALVKTINENTIAVAEFLMNHPAVKKFYWAYSEKTVEEYKKIERAPGSPGGLISMEIALPLSKFYDRVNIAKGPSFGLKFSILCPYIYLVHYDLLQTEEGRNLLKNNELNPELIRISIGTESASEIIQSLDEALKI